MTTTTSDLFCQGFYNASPDEQLIAFWTHVIDTFASVLESNENIYTRAIDPMVFKMSRTTETYAYMGAVRAGFYLSIQNLPDHVQREVRTYWNRRMCILGDTVPDDVSRIDFVLGSGDPFQHDK